MTLPDTQILSVYWSAEALSVNTILVLHLVGSMLLGMMVGYERSYQGRAAGMRTYALVCMASTAAVALSGEKKNTEVAEQGQRKAAAMRVAATPML